MSAFLVCLAALLQLGVLLHQCFQAEAWKLYSNLGVFAFSFAAKHRSLAEFGVANFLTGPESALPGRLRNGHSGPGKLLAARGEELGDVVDRVVGRAGVGSAFGLPSGPVGGLVSSLVGVVRRSGLVG